MRMHWQVLWHYIISAKSKRQDSLECQEDLPVVRQRHAKICSYSVSRYLRVHAVSLDSDLSTADSESHGSMSSTYGLNFAVALRVLGRSSICRGRSSACPADNLERRSSGSTFETQEERNFVASGAQVD